MSFILGPAIILVAVAIFLLFNLKLSDFERGTDGMLNHKGRTLKAMALGRKSPILGYIRQTQDMLKATGQTGKTYILIVLALLLMLLGFTSGVSMGNYFLAPVLSVGFAFIPFLYVRFQHVKYNRLVVEELEISLSTISISYERSENILAAVEENLENMNMPIKEIFETFVFTVRHVNPSIELAIDQMKGKINHSVWKEWCDSLKRCVQNRGLKHILRPTVNKLTKIKLVTGDLQNILYEANMNFWAMLVLTGILLLVGVYAVPGGLQSEIPESLANGLVAVNAALMAYAAIKVSFEIRDINFDL